MKIESHGASLEFELVERPANEVIFVARFRNEHFAGETLASNFQTGAPDQLFAAMAENWRGWGSVLEWSDYEDRLSLSATADVRGRVTLTVTIYRSVEPEGKLVSAMVLDAGALDGIAKGMKSLFA